MKTYNRFQMEIKRLRRIYHATQYSFNEVSSLISEKLKEDVNYGYTRLSIKHENEDSTITNTIFEFKSKLKSQYPRYLRELIFIRIISAFEVFLIDSIREIFKSNKEPFKNDNILEITHGELLSADTISEIFSKLINKDCRNLHSGGLKEIRKYYNKTFNIDLNSYCDADTLEEYHDRRHILVHRLGETDAAYRNKYASGKRITVKEPYLLECFSFLLSLCEKINEQLDQKFIISQGKKEGKKEYPVHYELFINIVQETSKNLLKSNYQYWVDNRLIFLRDILESKKRIDSNNFEMAIRGDSKAVRGYIRELKLHKKNGYLSFTIVSSTQVAPCKLSNEQIELIRQSLPNKPWPIGIHKIVAEKLGMNKSEVYSAINQIVSENEEL